MQKRPLAVEVTTPCLLLLVLWWLQPVSACTTPVFRYAMTYWKQDAYTAYLFHRGELSHEHRALIERLTPMSEDGTPLLNIIARPVDLDEPVEDGPQQVWDTQAADTLPWLVVTYPDTAPVAGMLWSGPFTPETIAQLADSPRRRHIADRLTQGHAAVWVLLETGNDKANNAAAEVLAGQLERLGSLLSHDDTASPEPDTGVILDPVAAQFSLSRLSRNDKAERLLIDMLLDCEPDLRQYDTPMVLPVFGRGRVLYALVGDGINAGQIEQTCRFITEGCQCEVKRQNPGADLLIQADWQSSPTRVETEALSSRTLEDTIIRQAAPFTLPTENESPGGQAIVLRGMLAVFLGVGAVAVLAWAMARRTQAGHH